MHNSKRVLLLILGFSLLLAACINLTLEQSDQAALESLREAGSDLSKPHPFDFYLYHNNKSGAQRLCGELNKMGFQVNVREGAIENEWLCLARQNFIPSENKLAELSQVFEELISTYGGEYDGWETIVID